MVATLGVNDFCVVMILGVNEFCVVMILGVNDFSSLAYPHSGRITKNDVVKPKA